MSAIGVSRNPASAQSANTAPAEATPGSTGMMMSLSQNTGETTRRGVFVSPDVDANTGDLWTGDDRDEDDDGMLLLRDPSSLGDFVNRFLAVFAVFRRGKHRFLKPYMKKLCELNIG